MSTRNKTRFHSLALGKENNFQARTDGLISAGDTTPSVDLWSLLYANTGGDLAITYFDDSTEGQIVHLVNLGAGGVSFIGAQLVVADSADLAQNSTITFINHNSAFYELGRSQNNGTTVKTITTSDTTPSVKGATLIKFTTDSALTVTSFDDGYPGQIITVMSVSAAITITNGGVIINGRSDSAYVLTGSDATSYVFDGSVWYNLGIGATAV